MIYPMYGAEVSAIISRSTKFFTSGIYIAVIISPQSSLYTFHLVQPVKMLKNLLFVVLTNVYFLGGLAPVLSLPSQRFCFCGKLQCCLFVWFRSIYCKTKLNWAEQTPKELIWQCPIEKVRVNMTSPNIKLLS